MQPICLPNENQEVCLHFNISRLCKPDLTSFLIREVADPGEGELGSELEDDARSGKSRKERRLKQAGIPLFGTIQLNL